jgi:hypothetical protein
MIREYAKGVPFQVSEHFLSTEYDCHCTYVDCKVTLIDEELVEKDEKLRAYLGIALVIDSGFRCHAHQQDLRDKGLETSKGISSHEKGMASDKWASGKGGVELSRAAQKVGFKNIGVAPGWIHTDTRAGKRVWFYCGVENAKDLIS